MDFDFTDKTLHLTFIPPLGCLLCLSDEGSGFVQVFLDFGLQSRGSDCSTQRRAVIDLPRMINIALGLMNRLRVLRVRMAGLIGGASQDRSQRFFCMTCPGQHRHAYHQGHQHYSCRHIHHNPPVTKSDPGGDGITAPRPDVGYLFFMLMLFLIRSRVARYSLLPGSAANAFSMEAIASVFFSAPIATKA